MYAICFSLNRIDENQKICYFYTVHPAWLQVLKHKDLPNWTRPLEDKTMNIAQFLDQTIASLKKVDWEQVTKDLINLWVTFFKVSVALVIITYLIGKTFSHWVHRTNDWLAHHWVRLIVPPPSVEKEQAPIVAKAVSTTTLVVAEVEPKLPPATTELVKIQVLQEQPPPARRSRSRKTVTKPAEMLQTEADLSQPRYPRGRRALQERKKNRQAA